MTADFSWINCYTALASKLWEYKDKQKELIFIIKNRVFTDAEKENFQKAISCEKIDPFSVFACFNCLNKGNRIEYVKKLSVALGLSLEAPTDFSGVPNAQPLQKRYHDGYGNTVSQDIDVLWALFDRALRYAQELNNENYKKAFELAFDEALKINGIAIPKLTAALFWFRPNVFVSLDSNVCHYLTVNHPGTIPTNVKAVHGQDYTAIMAKIHNLCENQQSSFKSISELSHVAYIQPKNHDAGESTMMKPQTAAPSAPLSKKTDIALNTILYGPPGTGKTYHTAIYAVAICDGITEKEARERDYKTEILPRYEELIAEKRIVFTTFHQSYGYEDFMEGIKPKATDGSVVYQIESGVFKRFCENEHSLLPSNKVFIIDEINRGNISKIFGELITLIEDDKRGSACVTLPYSGESFTVPKNVYVLGTMNTADRSIALMDTALRRRFTFTEMMPEPSLLSDDADGISVRKLLTAINERIECLYDREHTVGHAYFKEFIGTDGDIAALRKAFKNRLLPLLQEYFYDDYEKIALVLADGLADEGERFITERKKAFGALGGGYGEEKKYDVNNDVWKLTDDAFKARLLKIYHDLPDEADA